LNWKACRKNAEIKEGEDTIAPATTYRFARGGGGRKHGKKKYRENRKKGEGRTKRRERLKERVFLS